MLETLDYTIRIGGTPTFLYFDLYLYSAYAAHYVYFVDNIVHRVQHSIVHDLWQNISYRGPLLTNKEQVRQHGHIV